MSGPAEFLVQERYQENSSVGTRGHSFAEVAFVLLLCGPLVDAPAVSFIGYIMIAVTAAGLLRLRFPRRLVKLLAPLFALTVIGLHGSLDHGGYAVSKDIWYFIKPIVLLCASTLVARVGRLDVNRIVCLTVLAGCLSGAWLLSCYLVSPSILDDPVNELRNAISGSNVIIAVACALVTTRVGAEAAKLQNRFVRWAVVLFLLVSLALTFSRTYWMVFLITTFAIRGWWTKISWRACLLITGFVCIVVTMSVSHFGYLDGTNNTFVGKLAFSVKEVIPSDYDDRRDILKHWRGYEAYRGMMDYAGGSTGEHIFGQGFGAIVDTGIYVWHHGSEYDVRRIPILHNGYVYLLVKVGALGLLLYMLFLSYLFFEGRQTLQSKDITSRLNGNLLIGMFGVLVATTFVITGLYNKVSLDPVIATTGALLVQRLYHDERL